MTAPAAAPQGLAEGSTTRSGPTLPFPLVATICLVIAVASLTLPGALAYDPMAWVVWGREVVRLDLDTVGGPSWKPLPVAVTAVLAPLGELLPALWLVVARTAGLIGLVGVFRLARRLDGAVAGVVAAGLMVLTPDGEPRFVRTWAEGHDAPATAALAVWAVERHLAGRRGAAFALGVLLALLRPEAWPFVVVHALWWWRTGAANRVGVVVGLTSIPVLWFGGDWWGAGDPWQGAAAAQVIPLDLAERAATSLGNVGAMVIVPAWLAAAAAVGLAMRRRDPVPVAIAGLAMAWAAVVVAMAVVFGYAALSRFLLPAAALVCVLAGTGVTGLVRLAGRRGRRRTGVVVVSTVAVCVPFVAIRSSGLGDVWDEVRLHDALSHDLAAAVEGLGGRDTIRSCGRVAVEGRGQLQPETAWRLDVPLRRVRLAPEDGETVFLVVTDSVVDAMLDDDPSVDRLATFGSITAQRRVGSGACELDRSPAGP